MSHEGFSRDDMQGYTKHPPLHALTDAEFSHALDDLQDGNLVARSLLIADRFNLWDEIYRLRAKVMPDTEGDE